MSAILSEIESLQSKIENRKSVLSPAEVSKITGQTRLVGVIGWPVAHSLSPAMHNAAFAVLGLNYAYAPLPVPPDRVGDAVRGLAALGFAGANVTVPHKPAVLPFMDDLTPIARAVAAVNTIIVRPDGSLLGDNTDGYGFMADLRGHGVEIGQRSGEWANGRVNESASQRVNESMDQQTSPCHRPMHGIGVTVSPCHRVILLGAGGAARAVAYALAEAGAPVAVCNRTLSRAEELCQTVCQALPAAAITAHPFPAALPELADETDLIVNATSLGLHGEQDPLPWDPAIPFRPGQVVYDLIYNVETPLLKLAAAGGAQAIAGLGMLVHQGARSFELWTGREAPVEVMLAAVMDGP